MSAPEERQPQQDLRGRQGFRWEGDDAEALRTVLEAAFDYRGDVTLRLRDGGELTGYLSNRDQEAPEPYVMLLPADGGPRQRVLYSAICGVAFTGRDTAEGKSWQNWLRRYQARKEAEARGERVEAVDLFPESLD